MLLLALLEFEFFLNVGVQSVYAVNKFSYFFVTPDVFYIEDLY